MAKTALLIGVSEYEPGLTALPSALRDVEAMCGVLSQVEVGGFDQVSILKNPDPLEMQIEIQKTFSSNCKKNDLVLLFFSGHGVKDDRGHLYLTTRLTRKTGQGDLVKGTAVSAQFIHNLMDDCRSRRQIIILDCCFSGAFAAGLSAKDDGSIDIKTQLGNEGRVILTSSTSTQYSFEQKDAELSIYTRYLVEGLESGVADQDRDGMVSVADLHAYAKERVQDSMPNMKPEIYAIKEGYKILLAKSPHRDKKELYRREVEKLAKRRTISLIGRMVLDELKQQLGLSHSEAESIERQVLKPYQDYQEKLQRYEQAVNQIKRRGPVGEMTRFELNQLQKILEITSEDAAKFEAQVISSKVEPVNTISEADSSEHESPPEFKLLDSQSESNITTSRYLSSDFLKCCEEELSHCVGPMASLILKDILAEKSQLSPSQFIELLAAEIPTSRQAEDFIRNLSSYIATYSPTKS